MPFAPTKSEAGDVDAYIAGFPPPIRKLLSTMRATIRKVAAGAGEKISYGIPTFTLNGNLVHFAAFKKHIGFYPGSGAMKLFAEDFAKYESGPGSVQFPFDAPLPLALVTRVVKQRVRENLAKGATKGAKAATPKTAKNPATAKRASAKGASANRSAGTPKTARAKRRSTSR